MHQQNRLALAISAGLTIAAPAVVHAQCPAPVGGIIAVTAPISATVQDESVCALQSGESISVGSNGSVAATSENGGAAIEVADGVTAGYIEINGEASVTQSFDSLAVAGIRVDQNGGLTNALTVAGKVSVQSDGRFGGRGIDLGGGDGRVVYFPGARIR